MASQSAQRNIVIIGGGIIGCASAYFLTRHPLFDPAIHKITILEAQSIASGASGKAGGLLALWAYPADIVPLSYKLHAELANQHDGAKRWGYRALNCGSVTAKARSYPPPSAQPGKQNGAKVEEWQKLPKTDPKGKGKKLEAACTVPKDLDWFYPEAITSYSEMGDPSSTAQVHPYKLTTSLADLAVESGAQIILGSATAIDYKGPNGVKSVTYEDKATRQSHTIPATDVILAGGPWTSTIFPEAPIESTRAHSVVFKADVSPYAVFTEISLPKDFATRKGSDGKKRKHGKNVNPEMYARPDGTVYACGEVDDMVPLPKSSDLVICDEDRCQDIVDYIGSISGPLRDGEVLIKQACYLPLVEGGGGPLIGETGIRGLLMATGHTCWGIQNSCATGKLISEFVFDGKAMSARIESLDPRSVLL